MKLPGKIWGGMGALALWTALLPASALAQQSAPPTGGNGFKVGDGRLHPYFDLESRLDSGMGYFRPAGADVLDGNVLSPKPSSEVALHLRPGFRLEMPSPSMPINLAGNLDYVLYTGLMTAGSSAASHLEGAADLLARFNPESPLSFELGDQLARSDRTRTVAVGAGVLSLFNEARAKATWRPGGGALEISPSLAYAVEFFKPLGALAPTDCTDTVCDPATADRFDYSNLRFGLEGRWRFLPKTAVVVDTGLDSRGYFHDDQSPSALLLHGLVGVAGLVSPKITVTAKVGWKQNLSAGGGGALVTQLEGNYLFSPTLTFKGGYLRTLEPVAAYGLFRDDRGYAEARAFMGGRLTLHAGASVDFLHFAGTRSDTLVSLDAGPEYLFRPWLTGAAGYMLSARSSSETGGGINYTRHEGYARLSVLY
ncbi:hypothetical protein DRW03_26690 [Corallococcus sp. H22C18031201]|uniref:hypothetical protein n=1 Tax=Citreicoccus inhibens TaxID=2849499 RepID=UPI000E758C07|nr:hypothetical protein [Citreicoccus inhibens]MBU8899555.1 hypothetical protein [Citreicoccus inhibens]RJS18149.1 hypothetical protein DRW03_26690 [Corallococcus sp. H22C18031201]